MTRFQKLAAVTLGTAILLVIVGVVVRATDLGSAAPIGRSATASAAAAGRREGLDRMDPSNDRGGHRVRDRGPGDPGPARPSRSTIPGLAFPRGSGACRFQAWLGRETVRLGNSGESVTAHLTAAMLLVALLVFVTVRAGFPSRFPGRGSSQRFTLLAAFTALATFALLLFGSNVTATDSALVFPDWPLMGGTLFPTLTEASGPRPPSLGGRGGGRHGGGGCRGRVADAARTTDARATRGRRRGPVRRSRSWSVACRC